MLLTRCRHQVTGAEAEFPTDTVGAWSQLGWNPITGSRTVLEAEAEYVQAHTPPPDGTTPTQSVPAVAQDQEPPMTPTVGDAGTTQEN